MAAVYLLVLILDSLLSRINIKAVAVLSIALVIAFTANMIYYHNTPNIVEGITDYDAYKATSSVEYDIGHIRYR